METSKSTLKVARMALETASGAVANYTHRNSPRKFTQPQLFACLVVRQLLKLDYRRTPVLLQEVSDLRGVLGLTKVPHFTEAQITLALRQTHRPGARVYLRFRAVCGPRACPLASQVCLNSD